ncbi:MAG: FAD-dependent oxidoreductase [Actinomycetota bacterium]|nr:FAD-dependent oxidoreductase [Actinomycetota bacterium]
MAHTPLASRLREAASVASEATARGTSTDRVLAERAGRLTRRELLAGGAGLAVVGALGSRLPEANAATAPRIVVVGGGLAGLTCAYRLKQAGYTAQLHEASDRLGGRCWTLRGTFAEGQIAEHGGELIDQGHTEVRQLSQQLGLNLDNLLSAETNGTEPFYYFDGRPYSFAEATDDLKQIWQQLHKDVSAASYPTLYNLSTPRGRELDRMSIVDWIEAYVPGGMGSKLGQLLDVAYNIEYGAESSVQSSLNMLYLLAYSGQGQLRIFGPSNEKYHVRGGNDQIPARIAAALPGQVTLGSELVAIRRNSVGSFRLSFLRGGGTSSVTADRVVLALPFSILRTVDYSKAGFSALKGTAIQELGMGTNSKLHAQFTSRHWATLGCNGDTFADTGYQNTWDVTRAQSGRSGILVDYTGGNIGASFGTGTPQERAQQFLGQIEPVLPGISARWNGRATVDFWTGYPWTKGSYSYWKVGQYTKFAGVERMSEGACHFAGEHTSIDFQGYLNGAVETGERAAGEILSALR